MHKRNGACDQRYTRKNMGRTSGISVARTTDLSRLVGRSVLVLADEANLRRSARDLGYKVSFRHVKERIRGAARCASLHAVVSHPPGDRRRIGYLERRGWTVYTKPIEIVQTVNGRKREGNADFRLAFLAGVLISRSRCEAIVLASGDGALVNDVAACIQRLKKHREVWTLSLAGSTSWRLDAGKNPFVAGNLEIGQDMLRPIEPEGRRPSWRTG